MDRKIIIGLSILLLAVVGIFLFMGETDSAYDSENQETTKEFSELVLTIDDLSEGYVVGSSEPRFRSKMSERALGWGWKEGYFSSFSKSEEGSFSITWVKQYISIYPLENISKVISPPKEREGLTIEEIEIDKIGDESAVYYMVDENDFALSYGYYQILFRKGNILETIEMTGNVKDFEQLKEFAKAAERKF